MGGGGGSWNPKAQKSFCKILLPSAVHLEERLTVSQSVSESASSQSRNQSGKQAGRQADRNTAFFQ